MSQLLDLYKAHRPAALDRPALWWREESWTFRQVEEESQLLAARLAHLGIAPGQVVALLVERGPLMALWPLAVWKAGAAYLPLDPSYPPERLRLMVRESGAKLILAQDHLAELLEGDPTPLYRSSQLAQVEAQPRFETPAVDPEEAALILYTSGSTGRPKGIRLPQRSLVAYLEYYWQAFNYGEGCVSSSIASFSFDAHVLEIFPALIGGAPLTFIPPEIRLDLAGLDRFFSRYKVSHAFMTTQMARLFVLNYPHTPLTYLLTGGEKLPTLPPPRAYTLVNLYGPTETLCSVSSWKVGSKERDIPIGYPNPGTKFYILDAQGRPLPPGQWGELYIASPQIMLGYIDRPEVESKVLLANPFYDPHSDPPALAKMYASGDRVCQSPDGYYLIGGRWDRQVKIRGFRLELGEIEDALATYPGVEGVALQAWLPPGEGEKCLVGYYTAAAPLEEEGLRRHLRAQLPPYMEPRYLLYLPSLPLTPNGKVDYQALPTPPEAGGASLTHPGEGSEGPEPSRALVAYLESLSGVSALSLESSLESLALSSLQILSLLNELATRWEKPISLAALSKIESIGQLWELIERGPAQDYEPAPQQSSYPLSSWQLGLYLDSLAAPQRSLYNNPLLITFPPTVDPQRLKGAWERLLEAHPYLKTTIGLGPNLEDPEGPLEPRQFPNTDRRLPIPVRSVTPAQLEEYCQKLVYPFRFLKANQAFSPDFFLLRLEIYYNQEATYLALDFHHTLLDGSSLELLWGDLERAYEGQTLEPEEYCAWDEAWRERRQLKAEDWERADASWDRLLEGFDGNLTLPSAKSQANFLAGASQNKEFQLPNLPLERVLKLAAQWQVSPQTLFSLAFNFTLANLLGREESIIATIYGGRQHPRLIKSLGMFTKTYPLAARFPLEGETAPLAQELQRQSHSLLALEPYDFGRLKKRFHFKNLPLLIYQGQRFQSLPWLGGEVSLRNLGPTALAPLAVEVYNLPQATALQVTWAQDLYSEETIDQVCDLYATILDNLDKVERWEEIELLNERTRRQWEQANATAAPWQYLSLVERWRRRLAVSPERPALWWGQEVLSYAALGERSQRLARSLRYRLGSLWGRPLAILSQRSPAAYVGRWAALELGAPFLHLMANYPPARVEDILRESQAAALVSDSPLSPPLEELCQKLEVQVIYLDLQGRLLEEEPALWEGPLEGEQVEPSEIAYYIYTSGSTGKPKGVMVSYANLAHLASDLPGNIPYETMARPRGRHLAWCSLNFDVSILEWLLPSLGGGTIYLATEEEIHNPQLLGQAIEEHGLESLTTVPSYLANALESPRLVEALRRLKMLNLGGEACPSQLVERLFKLNPQLELYNCYGPSETTIACTSKRLFPGQPITLGRPLSNTQIAILSPWGRQVPALARGEMLIIGEGVGPGYLANPQLTAQKFVDWQGRRAYRSGDWGWWDGAGELHFSGRLDNQVKLHGLRLELGELNELLARLPGVQGAAAAVKEVEGQPLLVAYYSAAQPLEEGLLRSQLESHLPPYLRPQVYQYLARLPLTPNGKVDLKRLPTPQRPQRASYVAPATPLEEELCQIFAQILHLERVGVQDNFFDLGGASLQVSQVILALERQGQNLAYGEVFLHPTPRQLAALLEERRGPAREELPISPPDIKEYNYRAINRLLQANTLEGWDPHQKRPLGDIILTGATGFLGIHVLRYFLENYPGRCYCFMRKGKQKDLKARLQGLLVYYFSADFEEFFSDRLVLVEGDITNPQDFQRLAPYRAQTLINCSANVRHFQVDDALERVNVQGARHAAEFCQREGLRLIHISTSSVAGNSVDGHPFPLQPFTERDLYLGQTLENPYVLSKFRAERLILEAMTCGLDAKIMRVGNFMARNQDGEFQINSQANSFVNRLKAYHTIGSVAFDDLGDQVELSPIDFTAEAILLLAQTPSQCCLFHPFSHRAIYLNDLIKALNAHQIAVKPCLRSEFLEAFMRTASDERLAPQLASLLAYRNICKGHQISELRASNGYTMQALYRLHFNWPLVERRYLNSFISSLVSLGFFDDFGDW